MSEDLTSLLSSLQVYAFQEKLCVLQQINLCPSNKLKKKTCIRPCDRNNSTQILRRMYYHTAPETLNRLGGAKIS